MDTKNVEIERKFLVKGNFLGGDIQSQRCITQGYISDNPNGTVRVRVDHKAYLTIKGKSSDDGLTRFEWEKEITDQDAAALFKLCSGGIIDKTRYEIPFEGNIFEVDVFNGDNEGMIVAELELRSADQVFEKPSWLGREVTGERRYYNTELLRHPYKEWKDLK